MKELLQQIEQKYNKQQEENEQLNKRLDKQIQNEHKAKQESDNLRKQAYVIRQKVKRIQKLIANNKLDIASTLLQEVDIKLGSMYVGH